MKKILTIILFFILCALSSIAQDGGKPERNGSRIEALKIAYLTKKLDLSPSEAQRFWPIYNNYATEIQEVRADQRKNTTTELETEEKLLGIRKKYNSEFTKALSAEKINTFFRSEKEFGNHVRKELAERRKLRQLQNDNQRNRR